MLLLPFKCLRAGTRPMGSGALYMFASRRMPLGFLLRPSSACGLASWCCHLYVASAIKASLLVLLVSDVAHVKGSGPFGLLDSTLEKLSGSETVVDKGVLPLRVHKLWYDM